MSAQVRRLPKELCRGPADEVAITRRHSIVESRRTDPAVVDLVRSLGRTHTNVDLVAQLNNDGYLTGAGRPFDVTAVANLRSYHRIAPVGVLAQGEITVSDAARRVGVTSTTVYGWVRAGALLARRGPGGRICTPFDAEVERACQQRAATSVNIVHHTTTDPPRRKRMDRQASGSRSRVPPATPRVPKTS